MNQIKNIILISIDALRADHVSYHGYERETTPFLDKLQEDATTFTTAISPSSHTREAMPSLLTGRHPYIFADEGYALVGNTIAGNLSDYKTAGFHSNPYLSRAYGYGDEFDVFDDDLVLGGNRYVALAQRALNKFLLNRGEYHVRAKELNKKSLEWIDSLDDGPFFLWNHYMDVHGPYNPPADYNKYSAHHISNNEAQTLYQKSIKNPEDITDSEKKLLLDLYDGEIRYLDHQLQEFFTALERRGIREQSIIVVTSDHGDAFGEYGYFTHPRELHDMLLHVPLLTLHPQQNSKRISSVVSTLDIVPTILDVVGKSTSPVDGQSLLIDDEISTEDHAGMAFSSAQGIDDEEGNRLFAIRDERWKVILKRNVGSNEIIDRSLYSVADDPERQISWESTETSRVAELNNKLENMSEKQVGRISGAPDGQEVDQEVTDRLEALGYK